MDKPDNEAGEQPGCQIGEEIVINDMPCVVHQDNGVTFQAIEKKNGRRFWLAWSELCPLSGGKFAVFHP